MCSERKPSPNSKLVRNLCLLAGCSPYGVPSYQETYTTVEPTAASRGAENPSTAVECTWRVGILSLAKVSRKVKHCTQWQWLSGDLFLLLFSPPLSYPISYLILSTL